MTRDKFFETIDKKVGLEDPNRFDVLDKVEQYISRDIEKLRIV